jgi:Outer membrane protein beta-barrel domain
VIDYTIVIPKYLLLTIKNFLMKAKFILPLLAFLMVSQVLKAQFHIGIKAGTNISKVDGQSFSDQFRYGYHVGGFAEIGLGNKFGIQPEVLFNQVSSTLDSNYKSIYQDYFNSSQSRVRLGYLSIPILLNYKLIGNFLTLQAGPQVGILIDKNKELVQNGVNAFKNGDFSMVGGVQIKLSAIRLSGRYVIGLRDISDIDNRDRWRNQGLQLSLGLAL